MRRSINALKSGCKSLRYILEQTLVEGPELEEALTMLRSIYYLGRDTLLAEGAEADRLSEQEFGCQCGPGECDHDDFASRGDRLCWDAEVSTESPTIQGTLVTVAHVESLLRDGWENSDILRTHPELTEEDIQVCLEYSRIGEQIAV